MQEDKQQSQWQFVQDESQAYNSQAPSQTTENSEFSWSASEFIAYHKNAGWYVGVLLCLVALSAAVFFITSQDIVSTISILIVGLLFLVYASRKPRVLTYSISKSGIQIGDKLYTYKDIRSFAVIDEGSLHSISLLPLRRFLPAITMYYEPNDEPKIIDTLGAYLPKEDKSQDIIDRLMHKIRF